MTGSVVANATLWKAAACPLAFANVANVEDTPVQSWRKRRLQAALDEGFAGNMAKMGRALGYKDGAFVRQMLTGHRPITEKTVEAVEALSPLFHAWFDASHVDDPLPPPRPMTLADALELLGLALAHEMPADVRDDLADALAKLARRKGAERDQHQVLQLLSAPHTKRRAAA